MFIFSVTDKHNEIYKSSYVQPICFTGPKVTSLT